MTTTNRRVFMMQVAVGSSALAVCGAAMAQAKVDEKDPQAKGVSYVADASKADKAKRKDANAFCNNCALYQGKAADAGRLRHLPGQAGRRQGLVHRLGQEGLIGCSRSPRCAACLRRHPEARHPAGFFLCSWPG